MSTKDAHLYSIPRPKRATRKEISSSTSLSFSSTLSNLIASSNSTTASSHNDATTGRSRPPKEDIFATHNKNTRKRALKDLSTDPSDPSVFVQKHSESSESIDPTAWHRAKRRMEEKARLYAALKRGDVHDDAEKYGVDFDRKWAEEQEDGSNTDTSSGGDDGASDDEDGASQMVEYMDEFGRARKGTRREAEREERRRKRAERAAADAQSFAARPTAPTNIIYGNTIQTSAFNPDEPIAVQMEELARKRDRSLTPPPDVHFDATQEVRSKGVGFFQFSADAEERKREMEALEAERMETERRRREREERRKEVERKREERKKLVEQKRTGKRAEAFLEQLGDVLGTAGADDLEKAADKDTDTG